MEEFYNEIINLGDRFCKTLENIFGKRKKSMKTPLDRDTYIKLAEAYMKQAEYNDDLREAINKVSERHGISTNFDDASENREIIMDTVRDLLGEEFEYYYYECNKSFEEYNSRITLGDGTHPNAKNLGDLWDYEKKLYGEDNA